MPTLAMSVCPHCGIELIPTTRHHVRTCPRNPALRAAIVAALTNPAQPGVAVGPRVYSRRRRRFGAPHHELLYRAWGRWDLAAAYFGLRYERRRRKVQS